MSDERRQGFIELKASMDAVQDDVKRTAVEARNNRAQIEAVQDAVQAHDKRTALTGQKVDIMSSSVSRIEDVVTKMAKEVTAVRIHGEDTRQGLSATRDEVAKITETVTRHDERLDGNKIPAKTMIAAGIFAMLMFTGYHFDKEAMDATVQAIRGLF
jgi:HD-GYP domain-containing protein (c-di-GMP phosphodiesterase class II)